MTLSKVNQFHGENVRRIREIRSLTATDFSKELGVKKQQLSHWENNQRKPSFIILQKMAEKLKVPYSYFLTSVKNIGEEAGMTVYRRRVATPKREQLAFENTLHVYADLINRVEGYVGLPNANLEDLILKYKRFQSASNELIEQKADDIRKKFGLGNGPIKNVTAIIERLGIQVVFTKKGFDGIDALTQKIGNRYFILLNVRNLSAVRIRFNLAHELGHILLHSSFSQKELNSSTNQKVIEAEAHYFAGCLLMPAEGLALDLAYTNLEYLKSLKLHWKAAIQAIVVRIQQIGFITDNKATQLYQQISRNGWRKKEPYDDQIPVEFPSFFNAAIKYAANDGQNIIESVCQETNLNGEFYNGLFPYLDGFKEVTTKPVLRVI